MSEDVRQVHPINGGSEAWSRWPDDDDEANIRGVEVAADDKMGYWKVMIEAGEFFRSGDPLGRELQQRMERALSAVPGVTSQHNQNHEEWLVYGVYGAASGKALCQAAANVVDEMADRLRVAYDDDSYY
jgi:hypothetical protein